MLLLPTLLSIQLEAITVHYGICCKISSTDIAPDHLCLPFLHDIFECSNKSNIHQRLQLYQHSHRLNGSGNFVCPHCILPPIQVHLPAILKQSLVLEVISSYQTGITSINLAVILEYDTVYPLTISQTYPMHQLCVHPSNLQCVCYDVVMAFLVTYHHCDFIPCVHVFYFLHYQWIDYIQCMVFRIDKPSTIMLYQSQVL